jgi:hypothetical protein
MNSPVTKLLSLNYIMGCTPLPNTLFQVTEEMTKNNPFGHGRNKVIHGREWQLEQAGRRWLKCQLWHKTRKLEYKDVTYFLLLLTSVPV